MLAEPKLKTILDFISSSSKEELIWINGYIAGIINHTTAAETKTINTVSKKMTIVYGTETGNSKKVAIDIATKAKKQQAIVKLASLDQYRLTDLTKEENLLVVISTQGDGEPPVAAQKFYDYIHYNGFRLDRLKYSVLALGDTSYPMFCKTGEDVDEQLHKMGGKRIIPIQKCDVDYEADAEAWFNKVWQSLNDTVVAAPALAKPVSPAGIKTGPKKIYKGTVLANINLNDKGSNKETRHIELAADEVDYLPGDSIGIVPENPLAMVNEIIHLTGIDANKEMTYKESAYTVFELLKKKLNIIYLHERVVKKYAAIVQQEIPETKMDLLDVLKIYPVKDAAQFEEVINILPGQSPRIYTIASSNMAHTGEVHITVGKDVFVVNEEKKTGLCSDYLSQLKVDTTLEFFVQKNKRFKLPDAGKDIIMIGPGTGIAAFRSFLSERDATGASGRNWLFFGEDHFASDFLYQTEIQNWFQTGLLTNVNVAFLHGQPGKFFVQDKIQQYGKEFFEWVQSGAYVYVCGEKEPMSIEVENMLLNVIEQHGNKTKEEAIAYFKQLKEEGRYAKDVY